MPTVEIEHGIEAYYSGGPGNDYYLPVLACTCGFSTGRCDDWETAGGAMDQHLKKATPKPERS